MIKIMIYGRRLFDKSLEAPFHRKPVLRVFRVINSGYQWKYTWYFGAFLLGSMLLFILPCAYFVSQNYFLFSEIAKTTNPGLLEHLDREMAWLIGFSAFALFSLLILTIWLTLRMTGQIIGPLVSLERHMWKVASGDWSMQDFRIRADDDFRDLADTYSYMYRGLKSQAEMELKLLNKIVVDSHQKDSFNALAALRDIKSQQLAGASVPPVLKVIELPVVADGQRHAS